MSESSIARLIADEISTNCHRHIHGEIDRYAWDVEQRRLWTLAAHKGCTIAVMEFVAPDLIGHYKATA